jgi:CRISP-associated protein Cas1
LHPLRSLAPILLHSNSLLASPNSGRWAYDIADLYKAETTIPAAFEAVAGTYFELDSYVRRKCREKFSEYRLMHRIVQDIDRMLQFGDPDAEAEPLCFLWDDQLEWVEGGKNWSEESE